MRLRQRVHALRRRLPLWPWRRGACSGSTYALFMCPYWRTLNLHQACFQANVQLRGPACLHKASFRDSEMSGEDCKVLQVHLSTKIAHDHCMQALMSITGRSPQCSCPVTLRKLSCTAHPCRRWASARGASTRAALLAWRACSPPSGSRAGLGTLCRRTHTSPTRTGRCRCRRPRPHQPPPRPDQAAAARRKAGRPCPASGLKRRLAAPVELPASCQCPVKQGRQKVGAVML